MINNESYFHNYQPNEPSFDVLNMHGDDDFSEFDPEELQRRRVERLKHKNRNKNRDATEEEAEPDLTEIDGDKKKKRAQPLKKRHRDRPELWSHDEVQEEEIPPVPPRRRDKRRNADDWTEDWQEDWVED